MDSNMKYRNAQNVNSAPRCLHHTTPRNVSLTCTRACWPVHRCELATLILLGVQCHAPMRDPFISHVEHEPRRGVYPGMPPTPVRGVNARNGAATPPPRTHQPWPAAGAPRRTRPQASSMGRCSQPHIGFDHDQNAASHGGDTARKPAHCNHKSMQYGPGPPLLRTADGERLLHKHSRPASRRACTACLGAPRNLAPPLPQPPESQGNFPPILRPCAVPQTCLATLP